MNITDILKEAAQKKVSDLFIIAGRPLAFKINSQIVNYSEEILMPKETEELISGIYQIAQERDMEPMLKSGDDDFSFAIAKAARFRASVYKQRGSLAAVIRVISFQLPDPLEMHIPDPVMDTADETKGLVLITGPSGSGKSTIARLIASLWDVKDGEIDLGGVDIRTLPLAECTKRIAYVSQDNYLFDLSVMDNIRMGRKGATDAEVIDAAKKCGCHEFIMGLENGYQTVCGASGGHLSGGERQRISIARAMLKDAPIVILDEATSYTDPEKRGGHPVGTGKAGAGQDAAGHRPPAVHHCGRRSDHCCQSRQDRSDRHAGGAACFLPALSNHVGSPHQRQRRRGGGVMLQTLKKFFAFCVKTTANCLSLLSGWAWSAPFALPCVFRQPPSSFRRCWKGTSLWQPYGRARHHRDLIDHYDCINMKSTMLQTRAATAPAPTSGLRLRSICVPAYAGSMTIAWAR